MVLAHTLLILACVSVCVIGRVGSVFMQMSLTDLTSRNELRKSIHASPQQSPIMFR